MTAQQPRTVGRFTLVPVDPDNPPPGVEYRFFAEVHTDDQGLTITETPPDDAA